MKKCLIIMILALASVLGGCTHAGGDIGPLFGTWRLEELTADGAKVELYGQGDGAPELYVWAFQGELVSIRSIFEHQDVETFYGSWSRTDEALTLNFTYSDDEDFDAFTPPAAMHLEADGITTLKIINLTDKRLRLSYVNSQSGTTYEYNLKKAY